MEHVATIIFKFKFDPKICRIRHGLSTYMHAYIWFSCRTFKFKKKIPEPNKNFSKQRFSCCYFTYCISFPLVHVIYVIYFHCVIFSCFNEVVLSQNSYLYALVYRIQVSTNIFPLKLILDSSLFGAHINGLFIFLLLSPTIKNLTVNKQLSLYGKFLLHKPHLSLKLVILTPCPMISSCFNHYTFFLVLLFCSMHFIFSCECYSYYVFPLCYTFMLQ